jgi:hypothetical protein
MVKRSESAPLDFKGFSTFADHTSAASTAIQMSRRRSSINTSTLNNNNNNESTPTTTPTTVAVATTVSSSSSSSSQLRLSPVYLGNDPQVIILFRSIGQKKDSTTKIKCINELASLVFPITTKNDPTMTSPTASSTTS